MEKIILKAESREGLGKIANKHLRKEGKVPAVVYKGGKIGTNIFVDKKDLWHALHTEAGENAIITLDIAKDGKKTVIVHEIQTEPVHDDALHVDFHEISLSEKLKVTVPFTIKGEAVGVKEEEGILAQVVWDIEVECLPTAIPEHIDVRVDDLKIGDAIHVKDVEFPEGVVPMADEEQLIVHITPPKTEEEPEEVPEGEEEAEPEVIKKGKQEEEESPEEEAVSGSEEKTAE